MDYHNISTRRKASTRRKSSLPANDGPGGTITETQRAADIEDLIGKYAFGEVRKQ